MIGTTIQYILYGLLGLTITAAVAGILLASFARRGHPVSLLLPVAALSLIASTAPYIGLFGTVWHIIQALGGIGSGNLNVAAIAQPIGEALYATMWGLGCAIPAMIAHRAILVILPEDAEVSPAPAAPALTSDMAEAQPTEKA